MITATAAAPRMPSRLDDALDFVSQVAYATPEQLWSVVLGCAVTHNIHCFTTVPRFLVASKTKGAGKTTLGIHIPRMLAFQPFDATNATEPAIRAQFGMSETTLLYDEISKLFGEAGTHARTSQKYTILVTGYECTATASFSNNRVPDPVSIYGVAFMTGLKKAAPDDLRSRCVIIEMKEAPARIARGLRDALDSDTRREGLTIGRALHQWVRANSGLIAHNAKNEIRGLHPMLAGRRMQVWGPLFAVALAAGGDWPDRCRSSFIDLALDAGERPVLVPRERMLLDAARFTELHGTDAGVIYARDLRAYVQDELDREEFRGLSDNAIGRICKQALGPTGQITGTWAYPLDGGEMEKEKTNHKGWYMSENLLRAKDLEAQLNPPSTGRELDEFDTMFE